MEMAWDMVPHAASPDSDAAAAPQQRLELQATLHSFNLDCRVLYRYESDAIEDGGGAGVIELKDNTLVAGMTVVEPGTPDEAAVVGDCLTVLFVSDIEFLTVEPLGEFFVKFVAESDVTTLVGLGFCELLSDPEELKDLLGGDSITHTLADVAAADPLAAERQLEVPDAVELVDLRDSDEQTWPGWGVAALVRWAGEYLGTTDTRENDDGVDVDDLLINHLIRDFLYTDDDGDDEKGEGNSLLLELEPALPFDGVGAFNVPTVFEVDQVRVFGLDSFTKFENFQLLGKRTMQVDLALESVKVRVSGNLQQGSADDTNTERRRVDVDFPMPHVNGTIAVLLAVDEAALGAIPMSAVLDGTDVIMDCFLASLFSFKVADTVMHSLRILEEPDSPALQSIKDAGIEFGVGSVVDDILAHLMESSDDDKTTCRPRYMTNTANPFIDFRDLFLEPARALAYGGTGSEPYGNFTSGLKTHLDEELLVTDEKTGSFLLNSDAIAPFTKAQSGIEGTFESMGTVLSVESSFQGTQAFSQFTFILKDLRLEALDSFEEPTAILNPLPGEAFVIDNTISMKSLRMSGVVSASLLIEGLRGTLSI